MLQVPNPRWKDVKQASVPSVQDDWLQPFSRQSNEETATFELIAAMKASLDEIHLHGLAILFESAKVSTAESAALSTLDVQELQALINELFKALVDRKVGAILLSEFLARVWLSTRLVPSQMKAEGVVDVSIYPFMTTPTSNINEGSMADGTKVALKTFRRSQTRPATEDEVKRFFFEALLSSSSTTHHRNVMPSLGLHAGTPDSIFLVSKLQTHGTLPDYLSWHPKADRLTMIFKLEKVASALIHLHSLPEPILHGDIRGMNVLVDDDGDPLLMDLGFALVMDPTTLTFKPASHHFVGNPRWTPWEKIHETEYPLTLKADSFSFASFMLEVLSGDVPYHHLNSDTAVIIEVVVKKRAPRRPDNPQLTDSLWELMTMCWSLNPALRPSMGDIHRCLVAVRSDMEAATLPNASFDSASTTQFCS